MIEQAVTLSRRDPSNFDDWLTDRANHQRVIKKYIPIFLTELSILGPLNSNVKFDLKKLRKLKDCLSVSDSPLEVEDMWSKVSREKAAGGYPWTHLNHNQQEEVWINPLNLPQDITR